MIQCAAQGGAPSNTVLLDVSQTSFPTDQYVNGYDTLVGSKIGPLYQGQVDLMDMTGCGTTYYCSPMQNYLGGMTYHFWISLDRPFSICVLATDGMTYCADLANTAKWADDQSNMYNGFAAPERCAPSVNPSYQRAH